MMERQTEMPPQPVPLSDEAVTEHTAPLWKYKPVPQDQPEPFPEYCAVNWEYPAGRLIGARVRGKKHKHEGSNCDDWFAASSFQDLLFLAVSDGAGSRKFSRTGARESCRAATDYLAQAFAKRWTEQPELSEHIALDFDDPRCMDACRILAAEVQRSVLQAREAVEDAFRTRSASPAYAAALGRPLERKDFAATLLATAVFPAGAAGSLVITCQVGDGLAVLVDSKAPFASSIKQMGVPDSGEFSGETEFLTSAHMGTVEALQSRTKLSRGHSDTLLMMTDGVADDYFPYETEMHRLYCDLMVNGILEREAAAGIAPASGKNLPEPLCYPWVNDPAVQVPLHYTRRILQSTGESLESVWKERSLLAFARRDLAPEPPEERLQRWLDNYVERGSFDDRTLLIVEIKEA